MNTPFDAGITSNGISSERVLSSSGVPKAT
jgi:hypothetical protein